MTGTIGIVDYRGSARECYKGCDWTYDIWAEKSLCQSGGPCLYKHIPECDVRRYAKDV